MITTTPVRHFPTVDSTNTEARRLYDAGERGASWLLADEQTAGRGRLDRTWVSKVGNLYSTLLLPITLRSREEHLPQLGFAVALAVAETIENITRNSPQLKWPNDVLIDGAKVAGILCEVFDGASPSVAIGCGINVAHAPDHMAYAVTHLSRFGNVTRDDVFATYQVALKTWLMAWSDDVATVRQAWLARAAGVGEHVKMSLQNKNLEGVFEGLDERGAILIRDQNMFLHALHSGDLTIPSLRRQA